MRFSSLLVLAVMVLPNLTYGVPTVDFLSRLPKEVAEQVVNFIPSTQLVAPQLVSRTWRRTILDDQRAELHRLIIQERRILRGFIHEMNLMDTSDTERDSESDPVKSLLRRVALLISDNDRSICVNQYRQIISTLRPFMRSVFYQISIMGKAAAAGITLNDSADVPTLAQNESPSRTGDTVTSISSLVENFRTDLHVIADGSSLVNLDHPTWKSLLTRTGPLFYALQTSQTDYLFLFTRYIASRAFQVAFLADTDSWIPDQHWELAEILEDPNAAYTVHNIRNSDKKSPADLSHDPETLYNYDHRLKSKQRFMDNLISSLVQSVVVSFAARDDAEALVSYTSQIARLPAVKNRPSLHSVNLEVLAMAVSLQTSQLAIMQLLAKRTLSPPLAIEVASKFQESPAEAAELYRKKMDASEMQGRRVSLPDKNVLPIMIQADGTLVAKVYSPVEQL